MARLAAARGRRRSRAPADHVRRRRRAPPHRVRARLAPRLRGLGAGARRQRRAPSSSSSTSTARCSTRCTRRAAWASRRTRTRGRVQRAILDFLEAGWKEPDEGIWEVRGRAPALHALEGDGVGRVRPRGEGRRGVRARRPGRPVAQRAATRSTTRCCEQGFDAERNTFTQYYGSKALDASALMIPLVGFLPADRPAGRRHRRRDPARADARRLRAPLPTPTDGVDGLPPGEGVFLPCSFWLADNLVPARAAPTRRARCSSACSASPTTSACSPRSTTRRRSGMLGNFPQAFTHVSLVNTAVQPRRASPARPPTAPTAQRPGAR